MRRGRPPKGPGLVDGLPGSAVAKRRLRLILETIAGDRSVGEACAVLGIGEAAFHKLRSRFLQESVDLLEPRPAGRPASSPPAGAQSQTDLEAEIRQLHLDLQAARVRAELALAMPQVLQPGPRASKKGSRRRRSRGGAGVTGGGPVDTPGSCGGSGAAGRNRRDDGGAAGGSGIDGRRSGT